MTQECVAEKFLDQGRRKCLDYLIATHQGDSQAINLQSLAMTDMEIAGWCAQVAEDLKEQLTTA